MADELQQRLLRLKGKLDLLLERGAVLQKQKEEALASARQLQQVVDVQRKEIERLRMQVEYLRVASTIAPSREEVEHSRAVLTGLVREIDKCINDLTQ